MNKHSFNINVKKNNLLKPDTIHTWNKSYLISAWIYENFSTTNIFVYPLSSGSPK